MEAVCLSQTGVLPLSQQSLTSDDSEQEELDWDNFSTAMQHRQVCVFK